MPRPATRSNQVCDVLRFSRPCKWSSAGHIKRSAGSPVPAMADTADTANVVVRPPIAWALAVVAGLALNWLMPLPFMPAVVAAGLLGAMVFVLALSLVACAISTMFLAGSNVPTIYTLTLHVELPGHPP